MSSKVGKNEQMCTDDSWERIVGRYGIDETWRALHALITIRAMGFSAYARHRGKPIGKLTALRYAMDDVTDHHCTHPGEPEKDIQRWGWSCAICQTMWVVDTSKVILIGGTHHKKMFEPGPRMERVVLPKLERQPIAYVPADITPTPVFTDTECYEPRWRLSEPRFWFLTTLRDDEALERLNA